MDVSTISGSPIAARMRSAALATRIESSRQPARYSDSDISVSRFWSNPRAKRANRSSFHHVHHTLRCRRISEHPRQSWRFQGRRRRRHPGRSRPSRIRLTRPPAVRDSHPNARCKECTMHDLGRRPDDAIDDARHAAADRAGRIGGGRAGRPPRRARAGGRRQDRHAIDPVRPHRPARHLLAQRRADGGRADQRRRRAGRAPDPARRPRQQGPAAGRPRASPASWSTPTGARSCSTPRRRPARSAVQEVVRDLKVFCVHTASETSSLTADPKLRVATAFRCARQGVHGQHRRRRLRGQGRERAEIHEMGDLLAGLRLRPRHDGAVSSPTSSISSRTSR